MKQRVYRLSSRASRDVLRTPSARRQRRSLRSGYAFAHQVRLSWTKFNLFFSTLVYFHSPQEGFGRLITSGKIMRKLPQDFAFPLGLGGKKQHSVESQNDKDTRNQSAVVTTLNNNHHISNSNDISTTDLPGSSNSDSSPRAPYQDLDTINL